MILKKEDYEEPCCPLKMKKTNVVSIPTRRVLDKLDEALNRNDYAEAERLLRYWLQEAENGGDEQGRLSILNEQVGLYRKLNREREALEAAASALSLCEELELKESITMGTTLINAATAYAAFGRFEQALPLYERAKTLYEALLSPDDERLAGLCNNMALTLLALEEYTRAEELFHNALYIMSRRSGGEADMAVTWCNLADLAAARGEGEAAIGECLHKAQTLLDTPELERGGSYAYVCEKCAPVFGHYGYPLTEKTLLKRAKEIYERS